VTQLHYLPRRDELVQEWVDRIEVDVPSLMAAPNRSAIEVVADDQGSVGPKYREASAPNPPPGGLFPVANRTPGRGEWN